MEFNKHKGVVVPMKAVEGAITISESASVVGDVKVPVVAAPIKQGDVVALSGDFQVKKATGASGEVIIGFAHDKPEYEVDPAAPMTQAQAIAAGALRNVGVETIFTDVRTVPAKASENIKAGDAVKYGANGQDFEKSTNATGIIALCDQTSDNKIVIAL